MSAGGDEYERERRALAALLRRRSVRRGAFVLASGARSDVYIDCRLTTMHARAMPLIGRVLLHALGERGWAPQAAGGLTMGADPLAFALARESLEPAWPGAPIDAFSVRKASKGHGRGRRVEGIERAHGLRAVVLEDVCTSGGSLARAIEAVREAGMEVLGALCLVDRGAGGAERMAALGCPFARVFTIGQLLAEAPRPSADLGADTHTQGPTG